MATLISVTHSHVIHIPLAYPVRPTATRDPPPGSHPSALVSALLHVLHSTLAQLRSELQLIIVSVCVCHAPAH